MKYGIFIPILKKLSTKSKKCKSPVASFCSDISGGQSFLPPMKNLSLRHWVVFLGKTLYCNSASLYPAR